MTTIIASRYLRVCVFVFVVCVWFVGLIQNIQMNGLALHLNLKSGFRFLAIFLMMIVVASKLVNTTTSESVVVEGYK